MTKAILIEDDDKSRQQLVNILSQHFKDIHVVAVCKNNGEAKLAVIQHKPDLVITDIELEDEPVFNMLQQLKDIQFDIIFTTAHDKYAIQAIKFAALDYILKPFGKDELQHAIEQYHQKQNVKQSAQQLQTLFHNFNHLQKDQKKIALPTTKGYEIFPVKEVIRCEALANYTNFFTSAKNKLTVTKTLKEYEELLQDYDFFRVHHSHLINLNHVKKFLKKDNTVEMSDGSVVDVSRRKKEEFLGKLEAL